MEEILLFNKFLSIVDICLSCENTARESCAMVRRWRFFGDFLGLVFSASRVSTNVIGRRIRPYPFAFFILLATKCISFFRMCIVQCRWFNFNEVELGHIV